METTGNGPTGTGVVEGVRLDKWLWAVRAYRSRSAATAACLGGHVKIQGASAKPSRTVRPGDRIEVETSGLTRKLEVLEVLTRRVGAKDVARFAQDHTPPEEYARVRAARASTAPARGPGQGRPTKRERRMLDEFFDQGG
jgi:ribosome-associated heat shock protein Hsp15